MIYIFCLMIPWLVGRGVLRALYGRTKIQDISYTDSMLTGGMVIIGLAEAAHLGAVVLGRSFSDCKMLFMLGLVLILTMAVLLIFIQHHKNKKDNNIVMEVKTKKQLQAQESILFLLLGIMVLIQVLLLVTKQPVYLTGDMTVETVNTILSTNTVYQVNPMTGQPYTLGMPLRLKLLCLPTLYAFLCTIFDMSAIQVIWGIVPVVTLLGSYLAFYAVAKALFGEEKRKQGIFMIFVVLLLWVGDYLYGMDGFGVQHAGFRGVSIRMGILLPYTFALVLQKRWRMVFLCILAEACMVWTLYGMGACLFVVIGMMAAEIIRKKVLGDRGPGGEEDNLCRK